MIRGVNLGGWLLLERWITPSLFEGLRAKDEYSFCYELGEDSPSILKLHRDNFIREDDFRWIAEHGLNAVRIPVGYWVTGYSEPYIGALEYLDKALAWAEKYKLYVVIDLHGAPGSQNGRDHSGKWGDIDWNSPDNITRSVNTIETIAKRYSANSSLIGIGLLNEPSWQNGQRKLNDYYKLAYETVRANCGDKVAVIISDSYRPSKAGSFLKGKTYQNVLLDMHLYQLFSSKDKTLDVAGHIDKATYSWARQIGRSQKSRPVVVGEWSLALDEKTFEGLSASQRMAALRAFGATQLNTFEESAGWFYWTYRVENGGNWDYRECVEKSLLPSIFSPSS